MKPLLFTTLEQALPHRDKNYCGWSWTHQKQVIPRKSSGHVFERALKEGFLTVAHAGEEGPR